MLGRRLTCNTYREPAVNKKMFKQDAVELGEKSLAATMRSARGSGALVLAGRGLRALPPAVWSPPALDTDEKWWECCDLVKLDVAHNALEEIPNEVAAALTLLETVIASHNRLAQLPTNIDALSSLRVLNVSSNALVALPEALAAIATLRVLDASTNALREIDRVLPSGLCELRLDGNHIARLPDLRCVPNLESLSAARNELAELPPSLGELRKLKTLDVSDNNLTALPDLSGARALVEVDARSNRIGALPALPRSPASGASGLARLFLGCNAIRAVDGEALVRSVGPSLAHLGLNDNKLRSLPDVLGALGALRLIDVSNNDLSELPGSLGYIRSLSKVLVTGNALRGLRPAIVAAGVSAVKRYLRTRGPPHAALASKERDDGGEFDEWALTIEAVASDDPQLSSALRDAAASGALKLVGRAPPLTAVPRSALDPALADKLVALDLSRNAIVALEESILALPKLEEIVLDANELRAALPAALARLPLRVLRLRQNRLENDALRLLGAALVEQQRAGRAVGGAAAPWAWTLQELDLRGNRLRAVPYALVSGAPMLRSLLLGSNRIVLRAEGSAAECWRALDALEILDLSGNKVESLPVALLRMPGLTSLNIENNEMRRCADPPSPLAPLASHRPFNCPARAPRHPTHSLRRRPRALHCTPADPRAPLSHSRPSSCPLLSALLPFLLFQHPGGARPADEPQSAYAGRKSAAPCATQHYRARHGGRHRAHSRASEPGRTRRASRRARGTAPRRRRRRRRPWRWRRGGGGDGRAVWHALCNGGSAAIVFERPCAGSARSACSDFVVHSCSRRRRARAFVRRRAARGAFAARRTTLRTARLRRGGTALARRSQRGKGCGGGGAARAAAAAAPRCEHTGERV